MQLSPIMGKIERQPFQSLAACSAGRGGPAFVQKEETREVSGEQLIDIDIRPWSEGDLPLLERLMGDPAMTEHLGGAETPEKIHQRHERYWRSSDSEKGGMFVIVIGPERVATGSIGYWEREWRGLHVWETGWSVLPEFQG